jgi:hypothetical protein
MCPDYVRTNLSANAVRGDGSEFKKVDKQVEKGMSPMECAQIILRSIFNRELEVWICPFYYKLGIPLLEVFPCLHAWYLRRRLKRQLETVK